MTTHKERCIIEDICVKHTWNMAEYIEATGSYNLHEYILRLTAIEKSLKISMIEDKNKLTINLTVYEDIT